MGIQSNFSRFTENKCIISFNCMNYELINLDCRACHGICCDYDEDHNEIYDHPLPEIGLQSIELQCFVIKSDNQQQEIAVDKFIDIIKSFGVGRDFKGLDAFAVVILS